MLLILFIISGPDLPIELEEHSMVTLGFGQAIIGGQEEEYGPDSEPHKTIYHFTCSKQICKISTLNQELSFGRSSFVAIQIPDSLSGCIHYSKFDFHQSITVCSRVY